MSARTENSEGGHTRGSLLRVVGERWWLVLLTMAVLGGVAYGISQLIEAKYAATAPLAYSTRDAQAVDKALTDVGVAGLPHTLSSDQARLETLVFAERVSKAMGGSISADTLRASISASSDEERDVISVRATASSPELAAGIAAACTAEFVKMRQEEIDELLQSALVFLQGRIVSLTPAERESAVGTSLEQYRYALNSLLSGSTADYVVADKATASPSPYYPRPMVNLLWGLAAGLVVGLIIALLSGSLNRRLKDQATLERAMDLPVLGSMPATHGKRTTGASSRRAAVGFRMGNEPLLESMRTLRSNLKAVGFGETSRSILVTSIAPGEEKSTLAVNLTLSMALAGDRVILVDADLRNPAIHEYLGIPNADGLVDALADEGVAWSERIQAVELAPFVDARLISSRELAEDKAAVSKFLCLTSGNPSADHADILEPAAISALLDDLQGYSDYVIVNGPSTLAAPGSMILAHSTDAVIFASKLGKETAAEAKQVRQLLARAELQGLGLVICGARPQGRQTHGREV